MIRTRDFFLVVVIIAFLVVIVGVGTIRSILITPTSPTPVSFIDTEFITPEVVAQEHMIDRAGRLAWFKSQLQDWQPPDPPTTLELSSPEEVTQDDISEIPDDTTIVTTSLVYTCPGYAEYNTPWPRVVSITESEGSRVVASSISGTEQVLAVLPVRTVYTGRFCLTSDVIAISQTGALIRNSEKAGYQVFSETMLLGYTLDGFPLYGMTDRTTDECGGAYVDGTYRYYLSPARDEILHCFGAPPISLPSI